MIELTLPYPISANKYWRTRVIAARGAQPAIVQTYVSPEARAYREQCGWLLKAAGIREPIKGRIDVRVKLYPHRPLDYKTRMRKLGAEWDTTVMCMDLTNAEKVLLDALNVLAFEDDKLVWHYEADRMEPDDKGARVEISIAPIRVQQPQEALL